MAQEDTADASVMGDLASRVRASLPDFSRLFDTLARRIDPAAPPLRVRVQLDRLARLRRGAPVPAATRTASVRAAFAAAEAGGWLDALLVALLSAGVLDDGKWDPEADVSKRIAAALARYVPVDPESVPAVPPPEGAPPAVRAPAALLHSLGFGRDILQAARGVCQIRFVNADGSIEPLGTGFLVGPESVLTNWHVVRRVIEGGDPVTSLSVRFDFLIDAAPGQIVMPDQGRSHAVTGIAAYSPCRDDELPPEDTNRIAAGEGALREEALDYALLRVEGEGGRARHWYRPDRFRAPQADTAMYVFQYPGAFAQRTTSGQFVAGCAQARIHHTARTHGGASGGLCLGEDARTGRLMPVAQHHAVHMGPRRLGQAIDLVAIGARIADLVEEATGLPQVSRIGSLQPVFGRNAFRAGLAQAIAGTLPILVVRPDARLAADRVAKGGLGFSFSVRLMEAVLPPDAHLVLVLKASEIPRQAADLALWFVKGLPGGEGLAQSLPPLPVSESDQLGTLVNWIGQAVGSAVRGRLVWLVVDDLHRTPVASAAARGLIEMLCERIDAIPSLRIVLLGPASGAIRLSTTGVGEDSVSGTASAAEIRAWLEDEFGLDFATRDLADALANMFGSVSAKAESPVKALAEFMVAHFCPHLPDPLAGVSGD